MMIQTLPPLCTPPPPGTEWAHYHVNFACRSPSCCDTMPNRAWEFAECSVIDVQHSCLLDVLSTSIVGTLEKGKGNRTKREEGRTSWEDIPRRRGAGAENCSTEGGCCNCCEYNDAKLISALFYVSTVLCILIEHLLQFHFCFNANRRSRNSRKWRRNMKVWLNLLRKKRWSSGIYHDVLVGNHVHLHRESNSLPVSISFLS